MKSCPYCKIEVGGALRKCPFCQSRLIGTDDESPYFPSQIALRISSAFYKIQLFLVWTVIIACLGLDFLFDIALPNYTFHWSLLVFLWLAVFEFGIMRLFKRGLSSSRILTIFVLLLLCMLMISAYYLGYFRFVTDWVVPITLMGTMIANFVLAMIDRDGNSMIYLLSNLLIGVSPYAILYATGRECPVAWVVCLLVSIILFVGAIIFRGREVVSELHRRFNL